MRGGKAVGSWQVGSRQFVIKHKLVILEPGRIRIRNG